MSGYNGEPDLMRPTWKSKEYTAFEPTPDDTLLASKLLGQNFSSETEREHAITRLCEIAAVSGNISIRANLALAGGIKMSRADLFKGAIGVELSNSMDFAAEAEILRIADAKRGDGKEEAYELICASIGLYPALEPCDRVDPKYKHNFSHDSGVMFDQMNQALSA